MTYYRSKFCLVFSLAFALAVFAPAVGSAGQQEKKKQDETTAAEVKRKAGETYEALKAYSLEQKDEAVAAARQRLRELDARIDKMQENLDENWSEMSRAARQETRATMDRLQEQRREVAEWYGGIQHSSSDAWEKVKKGFADSYERLEKAFVQAREEFSEQSQKQKKVKQGEDD